MRADGGYLDLLDARLVGSGIGAPVAGEHQHLFLRPLSQGGLDLGHDLVLGEVWH
jgi:hypothetical protein